MIRIGVQIETMFFLDFLDEKIGDLAIEIVASEMRVSVGCQNFKDAIFELQDGDIEGSPAKVIDGNRALSFLLEPIGQRGSGRFINNPQYVESCNHAGV